jgi:hypothetical protein
LKNPSPKGFFYSVSKIDLLQIIMDLRIVEKFTYISELEEAMLWFERHPNAKISLIVHAQGEPQWKPGITYVGRNHTMGHNVDVTSSGLDNLGAMETVQRAALSKPVDIYSNELSV